jgi:methionyl-tRNA formyltransferase
MTTTSETIVFFGTEEFSLTVLEGLIEAGYTIAAVVTKPDTKKGRGRQLVMPSVKVLAQKHDITVWQPAKVTEINENIKALGNVTGVLVSYGKIIPKSTIDLFTPGIINVHPSLLPKYRGPSPIESAIKNGDAETGVSIMQLTAAMDAGPVYAALKHPLAGTETRADLYRELAIEGTDLLLEVLPGIMDGKKTPTPQNEADVTYCQLLKKEDSELDLAVLTAQEAERRVRAYLGFPKSKVAINGNLIIVTKAHVSSEQKTPLDLMCRDGAFLTIDELIAPSGRYMNGSAFLRGYAAAA